MWRVLGSKVLTVAGRCVLWVLLLLVLVSLPVLGVIGSETGSRWLLEKGLGMQRMLALEVRGGTLLTGMELSGVRLHTRKSDLYVRHLLARWSLLQLLRGEIDLYHLQAEGVVLTLTAPPSRDPVKLPRLVLPIALDIHDLRLANVIVRKQGREWPVAAIEAKGFWQGASVTVERLQARAPRYGGLSLAGRIRLSGGYPVEATGQLSPRWLVEKDWQPLQVRLGGEVARLEVHAISRGALQATLSGTVRPLLPDLPYSASLEWSDLRFPWLIPLQLQSPEGLIQVIGDKSGLRSQGQARLAAAFAPEAGYRWKLSTDWQSVDFDSLKINGLGGEVNADGKVSWRSGLEWAANARLTGIDLSQHWPVPRSVLPVLSGTLSSQGSSRPQGSAATLSVRLAGGEQWQLEDRSSGKLWDPDAHHQANVRWTSVSRPVSQLKYLESGAGSLVFAGSRQSYRTSFETGIATGVFPAGNWTGTVEGKDGLLLVESLGYSGEAGSLQAGGEVDLRKGVGWEGAVVLDSFDTTWLAPDWSGQFSGSVSGRGSWQGLSRSADLADINITGQLRDQPVRLDGALKVWQSGSQRPSVASTGLNAAWGRNTANFSGGVSGDGWSSRLQLDLADPALAIPGLEGRAQGQVDLTGNLTLPDVSADLAFTGVAYQGYAFKEGTVELALKEAGEQPGHLVVNLNGMTMPSGLGLGNLLVKGHGSVGSHEVSWSASEGPVAVQGIAAGSFDRLSKKWSGQLNRGEVTAEGMTWALADGAVPVSWHHDERRVSVGAHCWQSAPAMLCLTEPVSAGREGRVALNLSGLRIERLAGLFPEGMVWRGPLEGAVTASWQPGGGPVAEARFSTRGGEFELLRDDAAPLVMRYDQFSVRLDAGAEAVKAAVTLESSDLGHGRMDAVINPWLEGKPLTGEVALAGLRLDLLQPFLPALSVLTGAVSVEGRLDGLLARPRFWGSVQLADGAMAVRNAPLSVDDMSAWIDVQGDRADFSGQLKSGEGAVTVSGNGEWYDQPKVSLSLRGDRFAVRQEPELLAELSPDLKLQVVPGRLDLTGQIRVPYARVNLKQLPERSVAISPDVKVLESSDGALRAVTARRGQALAVNADIELVLGNDVFFNGFGVMGGLGGGLRLRQGAQRGLEASGELELDKDSRYQAYGQKLVVRRGRLVFAGSISKPAIDAEAIREVDDKIVGIRVEGRANAPEATLFSEPAMAQADMLSYLVLGRPLAIRSADGSTNNDAMLAAAAIKLGARGGEGIGLTSGIGGILGVRDLSLDAEGSGDDTQVKVSGYLSPDLFLSYGVGVFTPVNTVTMRYQIKPRLYLEAVSSLENAIDLFYNFRF